MRAYGDLQLFTPGPVNVPPRVLAAGARPMLHHRTPEFSAILAALVARAQQLFGTRQDILPVHTSGRGAMEASITNLFRPGDEVLAVCNGKFGEMYAEIAERHGLCVYRIGKDWLSTLDLAEVERAMHQHPDSRAVLLPHCETTTAVVNDVPGVARVAKAHGKLTLVDCVSSAGCMPVEFDAWGLDVMVTASQKGLMSPAGLSLAILSEGAWRAVERCRATGYYVQFADIRKSLHGQRPETPGSTPVTLVACVAEALAMIEEEDKEKVYARHERLGRAIRAGLEGMGLTLFPAGVRNRSAALSAFSVPAGRSAGDVRAAMKRDFGLVLAGGLGAEFKDRVVRIGHMGYVYPKDALTVIAALEACFLKCGEIGQVGRGVAACITALG